ncbi:hypothetical protein AB6A40_007174 [Gnathostoma spinigerum]|uniref:Uncharacterized protein n=1 Tax=Gnathostoma spinigerum TaxID=75299 RepID=A0ABD6EKG9_9BILA
MALIESLQMQEELDECEGVDYREMTRCIQNGIDDVYDRPYRALETMENCCSSLKITKWCRWACNSAIYSPTLSDDDRTKRLEYFCQYQSTAEKRYQSGKNSEKAERKCAVNGR